MNKTIKYIFFDIGGVVVLDFSKTHKFDELLSSFGLEKEDINQFRNLFKFYESDICTGEKSLQEVFLQINNRLNLGLQESHDFLNDFVIRFESNLSLYPLFTHLRRAGLKLGLLTNMYPDMFKAIQSQKILPDFSWDLIIDSSIECVKKPDIEIYLLAEKLSGCFPEQILFIDNMEENLIPARNRGWHTLLYDPSDITVSNLVIHDYIFS